MGLIDKLFSNTKLAAWINHRNIYLLGIAIILCGLGWSNLLMSIGQFVLIGNWILELQFLQKWKWLKTSPILGIILSVYLLHLVGLAWTENFDYGFKEIRNKVPLLVLPLIIGTSRSLSAHEFRNLGIIYLSTLFVLSIFSLSKLLGLSGEEILDKRDLSINISHIRYGLNLAFAVILLYKINFSKLSKAIQIILGLWFLICLVLFELYTGLIILAIVFTFLLLSSAQKSKSLTFKFTTIATLFIAPVILSFWIYNSYQKYLTAEKLSYDQNTLTAKTVNGNKYWNDVNDLRKTNQVYIRRYICWEELWSSWNRRSNYEVKGKDKKGQFLEATLIRYLSSKGLTKDSLGVSQLTERDVKAIENGIANYRYLEQNPIENRLHKTFFEFNMYQQVGYANGYSIVMRWIYWKTAWHIIKDNFWFGVGTGDVKEAFQTQYDKDNSKLDQQYRRRSHNQYLAIWVAFGIVGLTIFLFSLIYPLFYINPNYKLIYWAFFAIAALSFLTEDTLETQAGVTFFALFNSLLLLGLRKTQTQTS